MSTRRCASIALAATALVLTACGSTVDTEQLEQDVRTEVEDLVGETLESVDCPDQITGDEGNSFRCTLTDTSGETREVQGTFTDSEGNFDLDVDAG